MKEIRIFFTDFWQDFNIEDNFFTSALQRNQYKIVLDAQNPEYLFYSWNGIKHFRYKNSVKIYFTGENDMPNFNLCDYGISSAHLNFGERYFRLPLYAVDDDYEKILLPSVKESTACRRFCNFVYSNAKWADPMRDKFFHQLSQYKKVDSGGKHLNNIGKPIADKMDFIKDYKFTVAFENSSLSGYTTEKLLQPMLVGSMPVYWGNPDVGLDFNTKSFIHYFDYNSMEEMISDIIYLDNNDESYWSKLSRPWINNYTDYKAKLSGFLKNIVDKPLHSAKQTTDYGYMSLYKQKQLIGGFLSANKIIRSVSTFIQFKRRAADIISDSS